MTDMSAIVRTAFQSGLVIIGPVTRRYAELLTPDALGFVEELAMRFGPRCKELLNIRIRRQEYFDAGGLPDFLPETRHVREGEWSVAGVPPPLQDRRVEITGPVDRKMVINALNSGANTFMADFEDSSSPTWEQMMDGQVNLYDAVRGTIDFRGPEGKTYRLNPQTATLIVRPRGWHLHEGHCLLNGEAIPAGLFDFGLFFFHNARALIDNGAGPFFYLPKMESHREARLWNEVFNFAQDTLGILRGTIKATALVETLTAVFEMHEILYELRDHAVGLNCGRWDYVFSFIKCMRNHPEFVLPDRAQLTMDQHFLKSYSHLLIQTCHRRGAHAMGGMAAQIPIKDDHLANEAALAKVRADKEREVKAGHDGTWVAHPLLVPLAREVFDKLMPGPNQVQNLREDVHVTAADLLKVPAGTITIRGLINNVSAALRYTESWLSGRGAVPIANLMEDAATAEISRAQIWQWIRHPKGVLEDGRRVTVEMFRELLAEDLQIIRRQLGDVLYQSRNYKEAAELLDKMVTGKRLPNFLTLEAYGLLA
ncbi:MAG: Malate synthase A [Gammaproteobacteria bacterium]|nr:Malate synthase A [Gammaproteobacteria bacterium]